MTPATLTDEEIYTEFVAPATASHDDDGGTGGTDDGGDAGVSGAGGGAGKGACLYPITGYQGNCYRGYV